MIRPKAAYLFYYAAMACVMPFIALYYAQVGLAAGQIGLLGDLLPLASAPLWGGAGRRHPAPPRHLVAGDRRHDGGRAGANSRGQPVGADPDRGRERVLLGAHHPARGQHRTYSVEPKPATNGTNWHENEYHRCLSS